jgi:hypothetical protein
MNQIILRPFAKDMWAGIFRYRGCYEDIAPYFTRSGQVYTGLTPEDEKRFEKVLRYKEGELANHNSAFWNNFHIRSYGKDIYLDLDNALDELKYTFLKNHKDVKNGIADMKANAKYILINQETEAEEANKFGRVKRRALKEFDRLTPTEIRQALRIFGHNADSLSAEAAEAKLMEIVEGNPEKFIEKWVNNQTKDTEALIKTAVSKNILRKNKTVYKYGTDVIGYTLEDAIDYIDNPINQDVKITILRELEVK